MHIQDGREYRKRKRDEKNYKKQRQKDIDYNVCDGNNVQMENITNNETNLRTNPVLLHNHNHNDIKINKLPPPPPFPSISPFYLKQNQTQKPVSLSMVHSFLNTNNNTNLPNNLSFPLKLNKDIIKNNDIPLPPPTKRRRLNPKSFVIKTKKCILYIYFVLLRLHQNYQNETKHQKGRTYFFFH